MEEGKNNSAKLGRMKQPVKTEWGAHYMVLTYFQGDTNSMVDEHFSRALSVTKNPQDLSRDNKTSLNIDNEIRFSVGLLEHERCSRPVQELLDSRSACLTGSAGLQNMNQRYPC